MLKRRAARADTLAMELRPFERWCQGRRSLGCRELTPEERMLLETRRRGLGWQVAGPIAGYLACALVLFRLRPFLPEADVGAFTLQVSPFLGLLLGLPIAILLAADRWREARDLSRDLRQGLVERFAPVDPTTFFGGPPLIEVCLPSGRVLTGPPSEVGRFAAIREVAPGPFVDSRVEQPADGLPAGTRLLRRDLSPEERAEIRHTIRRLEKVRASSVLLLLWVDAIALAWLRPSHTFSNADLLVAAGTAIVAALVVGRALRQRALARRMRADAAGGFALVFTGPAVMDLEEEALPHSRLYWSVAGNPAEWRGLRSRLRTRG